MDQRLGQAREIFAQNMRRRRSELGISQEKLAELCGLHRTYIGAVERAERNVSIDNIERISAAMERSVASMLSAQNKNIPK